MNLTEKHNRFYYKLKWIFTVVLLVCLATPLILYRVEDANQDAGSFGFFLSILILSLSFGLPVVMLGFLRTVKFEQSDCFSFKDLKGSLGNTLLFGIGFVVLYFFVEKGVGYLFRIYIPGGYVSELLYLVYAYHVFWIFLFEFSRK